MKVCRWDFLHRTSYLINHYTFDRNGDAIYATYDSTIYTTRIYRFSTTGVWQEVTSRVFTTAERPLIGSMQSIKVAFTPANLPVVVYYHKSPDAASTSQHNKFIVGTLGTTGAWTKVCDTIDTLESMKSFSMDLIVSSTGVVTLGLLSSYTWYTIAAPIFVQSGTSSMKLDQPRSGTPVSLFYDNDILYAATHNYGYGYTTGTLLYVYILHLSGWLSFSHCKSTRMASRKSLSLHCQSVMQMAEKATVDLTLILNHYRLPAVLCDNCLACH